MIVSEFDLDRAFRSYFRTNATPRITGIGFDVDTSKAGSSGKSAAFVKSIELFSQSKGATAASRLQLIPPIPALNWSFGALAEHWRE
jgi:hypothetical protein